MTGMQGIEITYLNICIQALLKAYTRLMIETPSELLRKVRYGKKDTLVLDAYPEMMIKGTIQEFDSRIFIITEETDDITREHWPTDSDPNMQPVMLFSDPTDRSKQFSQLLKNICDYKEENSVVTMNANGKKQIKNLFDGNIEEMIKKWENIHEEPASITGATSSITCVCKGKIIFTIIVSYITHQIIVACAPGIFYAQIPINDIKNNFLDIINLKWILSNGKKIEFPFTKVMYQDEKDFKRFTTFIGKTGYKENFVDSGIFIVDDYSEFLHHKEPGGPTRALYLSEFQENCPPIGFILANGEKIGEWIHWLSFVKYSKNIFNNSALRIFEIAIERPYIKEGILMSTSMPYSIFQNTKSGRGYLDLSRLRNHERPSRFRSMLLVTPAKNEYIISIMLQHNYREVGACL